MITEKQNALVELKINPFELKNCSVDLRNDEELVLMAATLDWRTFEYASAELRDTETFVLKCMEEGRFIQTCFAFASDRIKSDKAILLKAVEFNSMAFKYASMDLRDDDELFEAALNFYAIYESSDDNHTHPFKYAS